MDVKDMIFLKIEADDTGELEQEKGKMMRERMKRRIWRSVVSMLLVCGLCLGMPDVAAFAEDTAPTSGTCGENLTWKLDADGCLIIHLMVRMVESTMLAHGMTVEKQCKHHLHRHRQRNRTDSRPCRRNQFRGAACSGNRGRSVPHVQSKFRQAFLYQERHRA